MEKNVFYHDQGGRLVQVLSQAVMRENGRAVVLYQELFESYARKVEYRDIFLDSMNAIDGELPGNAAMLSLEKTEISGETEACGMAHGSPQELLMTFLDAQTYNEKLEILYQMKDSVTDYLIDTMALSLDMEIPQGVLEDRYQKLIRSLRTVIKYEANRLR